MTLHRKLLGSKGQGAIMFVLMAGIFLATLVMFGITKLGYFNQQVQRMEGAQLGQSVLSQASLKVQQIYAQESGCDPDVLDARLNALTQIADPGVGEAPLAIAVPDMGEGLANNERENQCAHAGCRQLAITIEGRTHLVTAGGVGAARTSGTGTCPRDGTIRLSTTISRTVYHRRVTLINVCTYTSCANSTGSYTPPYFENIQADVGGRPQTTACAPLPAMYYGSIVPYTDAPVNRVSVDDLRWARRYISSGAGDVGDTTYVNATLAGTNGACAPGAPSSNQCKVRNCIPAFDLNLDRANNEADLAILEYYLRGFIPHLPVRDFLN